MKTPEKETKVRNTRREKILQLVAELHVVQEELNKAEAVTEKKFWGDKAFDAAIAALKADKDRIASELTKLKADIDTEAQAAEAK